MICCCNKMDASTPKYSKARYDEIMKEVSTYLTKVGYNLDKIPFVSISGFEGDNMIERSSNLDSYKGPTLLEALDMIQDSKRPSNKPLCLSLQDCVVLWPQTPRMILQRKLQRNHPKQNGNGPSGKELEKDPKFLKNGDAGFVKMIPTKPMTVETFFDCSPLGRFAVRDMRQTVAVGVIKTVERKDAFGAKVSPEEEMSQP
ncbi:hypothetical protein L7F22_025942 [Adiantum nelumboides]|nr:hypothetical protein [Adiantum nelumboides]